MRLYMINASRSEDDSSFFAGSAKILHIAPAPKHGNSISPSFPLEDEASTPIKIFG